PTILYAANVDTGIFRSTDAGKNWQKISTDAETKGLDLGLSVNIKLATSNAGGVQALYAGVVNEVSNPKGDSFKRLQGVYQTTNPTAVGAKPTDPPPVTWTRIDGPSTPEASFDGIDNNNNGKTDVGIDVNNDGAADPLDVAPMDGKQDLGLDL